MVTNQIQIYFYNLKDCASISVIGALLDFLKINNSLNFNLAWYSLSMIQYTSIVWYIIGTCTYGIMGVVPFLRISFAFEKSMKKSVGE